MFTPARPQLPLPRTTLPPLSSILSNDQFNLLDFTPKHDMKRKFSAIANINTTTNSATSSATSSATTSAATSNAPTTANTPSATPTTISPTTAGGKSYAFISHSPATFPSQEPAIDNAPLARRKRRRTSANELSILNREFDNGSTPNKLKRIQIAKLVNMSEKAVQIWFQNKRQSLRKQFKSELEITELPPTPSIYSSSTAASSTTSLYSAADTSTTFLSGYPTPLSIQTAPIISHQMSPIVCSTPTKPILNKSQSFIVSPSVQIASPIRQRAQSIPITQATPIADYDESIDSIDDSYIAQKTLVETKKKQPNYLQKYTKNQCLTFKLTSSTSSNKISQKLANAANEASNQSKCKITNILNTRKPLGEINLNTDKKKCVESLISLKAGNWN